MNDDSPESLYEQTHRPGPGKNPIGRAREIIDEIEGTRGADILLAEEWVDEMIQRMGDDQQSLSTFDYIDISRSTLLKEYHLDQRLVNRLIKAIFIYSFGVHELLTQLVRHYPQPSEMIAALWNMYLQSIESGDRCRYETAIKAINDGDGEIEGNRRQLLDERCEQVEAREAVLEEKARELEERRALIKAGNHMECDVEEMEERAALLMEQNKELGEQGGRLEGEETDWRQTTVWYKGEIERLEREYMNNTGQIQILENELERLGQQEIDLDMIRDKLNATIADLNIRYIAVAPSLEIDKVRWAELKAVIESEAKSKEDRVKTVKRSEHILARLSDSEVNEKRIAGDNLVMITGQQRHNQDLAESIRVQENGLSITYGNLISEYHKQGQCQERLADLASTLDSHRQQLIGISDYVSVAEQEYESLNKDLYYIGEQYQTLIEEMDENLYEIGINDLERGHLEQDLSSSVMLESRLALEYEQVVKRYNELEQQMAHEQQLLDRVQGQYHHERILADQDDAEYNQLLKATKELQDRLDAERIDYETRVKADTTYSYDISRQIEELVNQRQEWDIKVDLAIASLRQAHDEIGQIQAVSKAVIGRDKEQEKLCHDIAIEYGNIQSALPPVLAKLRSLENNLATARIAYQSRILNIEMAIADGQSEHDQMVMDMDQARHQYNTEKEDWALTVEGLIREERMSADRETVKMDKILGAISYADSYLRTMQEAVNGLRLAKHYTELDNQAVSDELGKENQQLVQLTAESEQYQTQKSMLLKLEAIAVKALQQIISDISTSDEHRVVLERERIVCERILIRERKMSGQRQLELDLMAEEEWRRFRDLMSRSSSASPSMVDIAMTTDPVRTRGTREALTTAPVIVGLARTFDAPSMVIQEMPKTKVPRSIRLNVNTEDNFSPNDFTSLKSKTFIVVDDVDSGRNKHIQLKGRASVSGTGTVTRLPSIISEAYQISPPSSIKRPESSPLTNRLLRGAGLEASPPSNHPPIMAPQSSPLPSHRSLAYANEEQPPPKSSQRHPSNTTGREVAASTGDSDRRFMPRYVRRRLRQSSIIRDL